MRKPQKYAFPRGKAKGARPALRPGGFRRRRGGVRRKIVDAGPCNLYFRGRNKNPTRYEKNDILHTGLAVLRHDSLRPADHRHRGGPRLPFPPGGAGGGPAVLQVAGRGETRGVHHDRHRRPLLAGPLRPRRLYAPVHRCGPGGPPRGFHPGGPGDPGPRRHPHPGRRGGPERRLRDGPAQPRQDGGGPDELQRRGRRGRPDQHRARDAPQGADGHGGRPGQHYRQRLVQLPGHRGRKAQPDVLGQSRADLQDDARQQRQGHPGHHQPGGPL